MYLKITDDYVNVNWKNLFVDEFLTQLNASMQFLDTDEVLKKLSQYNIYDPVDPLYVKNELNRLFYVNNTLKKRPKNPGSAFIQTEKRLFNENMKLGMRFLDKVFGLTSVAEYVEEKKLIWSYYNVTLVKQLEENK